MNNIDTKIITWDYGKIEAFCGDRLTKKLEQFGSVNKPEIAMLLSFVRFGDSIIDAGANIGAFGIPMALKAGDSGKLFAVEANDPTYRVLVRNLNLAGIKNADSRLAAVAKESGKTLNILQGRNSMGTAHITQLHTGQTIKSLRLDDLTDRSDIIKIDVEGMDFEAAESASSIIESCKPIIYIEYVKSRLEMKTVEFEAFFRSRGYRCFVNAGNRTGRSSKFEILELTSLDQVVGMADLLWVHKDSDRLPSAKGVLSWLYAKYRLKNLLGRIWK